MIPHKPQIFLRRATDGDAETLAWLMLQAMQQKALCGSYKLDYNKPSYNPLLCNEDERAEGTYHEMLEMQTRQYRHDIAMQGHGLSGAIIIAEMGEGKEKTPLGFIHYHCCDDAPGEACLEIDELRAIGDVAGVETALFNHIKYCIRQKHIDKVTAVADISEHLSFCRQGMLLTAALKPRDNLLVASQDDLQRAAYIKQPVTHARIKCNW